MTLRSLRSGWMDGEGEAISKTALEVAQRLIDLTPGLAAETGIFPTLEGGVQFENETVEVVIDPDGNLQVTDELLEAPGKRFSYETFSASVWDIIKEVQPLVERSVNARKAPVTTEREDRLESILHRILPVSNTASFNTALRSDLSREFSSMRGTCGRLPVTEFSITQTLMEYDGPVLALVDAGDRKAVLMRLDEEEAGQCFSLVVPTPAVMKQLVDGDICLRQACLHQMTDTYVCDEYVEGTTAAILNGPICEYHLPLAELSLRELLDEAELEVEPL